MRPSGPRFSSLRSATQLAGAAVLLALSAAGIVAAAGSPRVQVAGLLAVLGLALWGGSALGQLLRAARLGAMPEAKPASLPEFAFDASAAAERLALRDSQLELMPVALWQQQQGSLATPVNARARRLIAPGGVLDRSALLAELGEARDGVLLSLDTERGEERWLASISHVTLKGHEYKLMALLPVESELEAAALEAWRQLVHVLTHEIMNSLTPIASLSRSAMEILDDADARDDLGLALDTISRRAEALRQFVINYRKVSELPPPRLEALSVADVFSDLDRLCGQAWRERGGEARFSVEPASLQLMADPDQLQQVLLNLVKNAAEATAEMTQPRLELHARLVRGGKLRIEVRDNGPGVPRELEGTMFLPFVSSRASNGAARGVGLAVVRSLVHAMGGTVRYVRTVQGGACFVLSF